MVGTIGDFRFVDYNSSKNVYYSYLLSIDIEAKHKNNWYATAILEGLIDIIKENYDFSTGLLIDEVNSSQGKKYLPRIAKHLIEKKSINRFVHSHNDNYIFLEF